MSRLYRWLFPAGKPADQIDEERVSGAVREAQQRFASSSRIASAKAAESSASAREWGAVVMERVRQKEDQAERSILAAAEAVGVLRGNGG